MTTRRLPTRCSTPRRLTFSLLAALLLASLAACSSGSTGAAPDLGISTAEVGTDAMSGVAQEDIGTQPIPGVANTGRSIVQEGSINLTVDAPGESAKEAADIANNLGGYVESQNLNALDSGGNAQAFLQLRVPSDRLDEAFQSLSQLGDVTSESRSTNDVTAQHVDLQARVKALEASVIRLTELMSGAATTSELLEAESALSQRQQELDGLTAQLTALEGLVKESSISVSLNSKSALPGGGPANFWEGLVAGWHSLIDSGAGALVLLGVLLPWLVLAAVITLVIVVIVRSVRRRRRQRPVSEPEPAPNPPALP